MLCKSNVKYVRVTRQEILATLVLPSSLKMKIFGLYKVIQFLAMQETIDTNKCSRLAMKYTFANFCEY